MKHTTPAEQHFDDIAATYDFWKHKNAYYYTHLKALFRSITPAHSRVLEIGCGTGDIVAALNPSHGIGTDISEAMIVCARKKYAHVPTLTFNRVDVFEETTPYDTDYILMVDVLEHIDRLPDFLKHIAALTLPGTRIVISVANPLWEPVLMLAEKMGMKMPEGPHHRYTIAETEAMYVAAGLRIVEKNYRLLIPKKVFSSEWVNRIFYRNSLLRRYGSVIYWVLEKA
mgnify:CR=1 FL=1